MLRPIDTVRSRLRGRMLPIVQNATAAVAAWTLATLFPPDPALAPGRAAQAMFVELGRALERIATALEARDAGVAERALVEARGIDDLIRSVEEEVSTGRETAKYTPPRRSSRVVLDRFARSLP